MIWRAAPSRSTTPGAFGSILSQPIINQPQAAIVTMEAIVKRPVVVTDPATGADIIAVRSLMNCASPSTTVSSTDLPRGSFWRVSSGDWRASRMAREYRDSFQGGQR